MTINEGNGIFGTTTNDPVPLPKGFLSGGAGCLTITAPVILNNLSPETIVINPAATMTQNLPTANVLAGKKFHLIINATLANQVSIQSSNNDVLLANANTFTHVIVTALVNTPVALADWNIEFDTSMKIIIGDTTMNGTVNGPTKVIGNLTITGNLIHNGDLYITGNIVNSGGYDFTVYGDLYGEGSLRSNPVAGAAGNVVIKGACSVKTEPVISSSSFNYGMLMNSGGGTYQIQSVSPTPPNSMVGSTITFTSGVNNGLTAIVTTVYPWGDLIVSSGFLNDDFMGATFDVPITTYISVEWKSKIGIASFLVEGNLICGDFDGKAVGDGSSYVAGLNIKIMGSFFTLSNSLNQTPAKLDLGGAPYSTDFGSDAGSLYVLGIIYDRNIRLVAGSTSSLTRNGGVVPPIDIGGISATPDITGQNIFNTVVIQSGSMTNAGGSGSGGNVQGILVRGNITASQISLGSGYSNNSNFGGHILPFRIDGKLHLSDGIYYYPGWSVYGNCGSIYVLNVNGSSYINTFYVLLGTTNGSHSPVHGFHFNGTAYINQISFSNPNTSGTPNSEGSFNFYMDSYVDSISASTSDLISGYDKNGANLPQFNFIKSYNGYSVSLYLGNGINFPSGTFAFYCAGKATLANNFTLASPNFSTNYSRLQFLGGLQVRNITMPATGAVPLSLIGECIIENINMSNHANSVIIPTDNAGFGTPRECVLKLGAFTGAKTTLNKPDGTPQTVDISGLAMYDVAANKWVSLPTELSQTVNTTFTAGTGTQTIPIKYRKNGTVITASIPQIDVVPSLATYIEAAAASIPLAFRPAAQTAFWVGVNDVGAQQLTIGRLVFNVDGSIWLFKTNGGANFTTGNNAGTTNEACISYVF
jgi:hypothetical protein